MELPRLSTAINVFSSLGSNYSKVNSNDLKIKRENLTQKRQESEFTFNNFNDYFATNSSRTNLLKLKSIILKLVSLEEDSEFLEDGVILMVKIFLQDPEITFNAFKNQHIFFNQIHDTTLFQTAKSIFTNLVSDLTEDKLDKLKDSINNLNRKNPNPVFTFGKGILFNPPSSSCIDNLDLSQLSLDKLEIPKFKFDMKLKPDLISYSGPVKAECLPVKKNESSFNLYDLLAPYYSDSMGDMSFGDILSTVSIILCSNKTNDDIQIELVDLLGYDKLDLVEILLANRKQLINGTHSKTTSKSIASLLEPQRPIYGCQVTIQTEDEKAIQKLLRRDEKKLSRKKENEMNQNFELNPNELKAQREMALLLAQNTPLFSSSKSTARANVYPFVFDSFAAAKMLSGFIGGSKMNLPVGFERINNSKFESIDIPHSEKPPTDLNIQLVNVSDLDEIGQIAFKGTKKLNLIQSIVCPTAYNSNENLLICAPTGAGKTNVAMLAILHEIKQHIVQGVIKKDDFKIIYVAPMKALAAEMVRNFGGRLSSLGISVMELTGDMQMTKAEITNTQMIVTTPEKWDVVTRKSTGDVALSQIVRLLIIDEVHLLHDDRGSVIESIVARTLRQVERSQTMIRIVGLSATLPNYVDVARFLGVSPQKGLFVFDSRFRPVPLAQSFIGIKALNRMQQLKDFIEVCYENVLKHVKNGYQVMVFVHARNETVKTGLTLVEMAKNNGHINLFVGEKSVQLLEANKYISHSSNKQLKELFPNGFAMHHAGMLRHDRNLVEKYFGEGLIRVIVCTATLAWGVNLPAHAVIIKGTQIYDSKKGSFIDLGVLDVMQIFGRAGRPQFDTFGHGTIITTHNKLTHYLSLLTQLNPIESQFINGLPDHLNAEIVLGTVSNLDEAVRWLSYTYLHVRMRINPLVYGLTHESAMNDPDLLIHRRNLIVIAARTLDKCRMIRFDERTELLHATDLGRTASHFYIKYETIEMFNEFFNEAMMQDKLFEMISRSQEFEQIKVREEELTELDTFTSTSCEVQVLGGSENTHGKVNILLQSYISKQYIDSFSLVSDQAFVAQNASRIVRALFEMALRKNWPLMSERLLTLSKMIERRLWQWQNPLRQFSLSPEVLRKLEEKGLSVDRLREMDSDEIGCMIKHNKMGSEVKKCAHEIPLLKMESSIQPITRTVLRVSLTFKADFKWSDKVHGKVSEAFWVWVEDPENSHIYHHECLLFIRKNVIKNLPQSMVFTIPIFDPLPTQYYVRVMSDHWLGSDSTFPINFKHLILPERHPPHTELLDLQPLPLSALGDSKLESIYNFTHFNPIQTQIFHTLYHTDTNVLLGAPTGSGKTIAAELAIFRVFREFPKLKVVYIAPLKALVRERMEDWKIRIEQKLNKKVVELTGDVLPDMRAVGQADLIVTTPEKWDGISRSWQNRNYVKAVALLIIDEIHLLGDDRGPVLEVIVSRTNFISSHTDKKVRVVGLSTALANARDLADWLAIKQVGLFNFRPSVRPVPLEVHISGFPGKHYCPRMATMNKPAYQAIQTHSPNKPVLVFVSSRRQTRLTALDLISYLAAEDDPKQWLHLQENEMEDIVRLIRESNLKLTLTFGIGIHHAGLHEKDRKTVEELFVNQKIQILIATSTLAWGVNFPAHLVIVKGTEYFDGKINQYVDYPITDVLQMMGRAGRPQFDDQGTAVIFVHDTKKHFYKKFLYEPFPVESSLKEVLPDHLNAEIVAGTIASRQDAIDYITWTYFFRRLLINPSYYKLDDLSHNEINKFLSQLVQTCLLDLSLSKCIEIDEDETSLYATAQGRIASYYYISHKTLRHFNTKLGHDCSTSDIIQILANCEEFTQLPVRHNEDKINEELSNQLPLPVDKYSLDMSSTKTHLLLQAHFSRVTLPSSDYLTDTKTVMDQALRVLQAMLDHSGNEGYLKTSLRIVIFLQMIIQGVWDHETDLLILPHVLKKHISLFNSKKIFSLIELVNSLKKNPKILQQIFANDLDKTLINEITEALLHLPIIRPFISIRKSNQDSDEKNDIKNIPLQSKYNIGTEFVKVDVDCEYVLSVKLQLISRRRKNIRVYPSRFSKPKDEGWILVLGEVDSNEVIALKRVGHLHGHITAHLTFFTPDKEGRHIYTLYVMSDSYLGLDQQYDVYIDVEKRCAQSIHDNEYI